MKNELNRIQLQQYAGLLGHIVGDALGVPVEFMSREKLTKEPVTDMVGGGNRGFPAGTWSDDSSMMLCTVESILKKKSIDYHDIMRNFLRWATEGYMTPHGSTFGMGQTVLRALVQYSKKRDIAICGCGEEKDNGNGSLMRLLPFVVYLHNDRILSKNSLDEKINIIHNASSITHRHLRSQIACGIYYFVAEELINEPTHTSILVGLEKAHSYYHQYDEFAHFQRLFSKNFKALSSDEIRTSGYVVDTLEAAIWCLERGKDYQQTLLTAVNLGGDADTVAAIAGGLAGILHGAESIPPSWIDTLAKTKEIQRLCADFVRLN